MNFKVWVENNMITGSIKPVFPYFSWPDMAKVSLDDDTDWFFYIGTYNIGNRGS